MRKVLLIFVLLYQAATAMAIPYNAKRDSTHYIDGTRIYADTAIYQGMNIKLDLGTAIVEAASSNGRRWQAEGALSWRLKNRFYPTLELGYAHQTGSADSLYHRGQGGFARIGLDINGLQKHPERLDALLIGVRVGSAVQDYQLTGQPHKVRMDSWGEILIGCQVQIIAGFIMGWNARFKYLFTERPYGPIPAPGYIPGFGEFKSINWGLSYYVGYKF